MTQTCYELQIVHKIDSVAFFKTCYLTLNYVLGLELRKVLGPLFLHYRYFGGVAVCVCVCVHHYLFWADLSSVTVIVLCCE